MDNDTASIIVSVFVSLSTVSFLLLAVGLFKPSFVIHRPSLQTRKGVFLVWGLSAIFLTGGGLLVAGIAEPTAESGNGVTDKIYGGILEALDTIDEALKMAGATYTLLELYDEQTQFLGNGGVGGSRLDKTSKGKGGIY